MFILIISCQWGKPTSEWIPIVAISCTGWKSTSWINIIPSLPMVEKYHLLFIINPILTQLKPYPLLPTQYTCQMEPGFYPGNVPGRTRCRVLPRSWPSWNFVFVQDTDQLKPGLVQGTGQLEPGFCPGHEQGGTSVLSRAWSKSNNVFFSGYGQFQWS